jgi:excisionase family DNA binding protein
MESVATKEWTTGELAEAAGLTDARIRQLLLGGDLRGYKLGRDWRVSDGEARRWLEERGVDADGALEEEKGR